LKGWKNLENVHNAKRLLKLIKIRIQDIAVNVISFSVRYAKKNFILLKDVLTYYSHKKKSMKALEIKAIQIINQNKHKGC
jgi:hypothetical protein